MDKTEGHKEEMLKLIMEQNAHIKEMEDELDKLVKEKEKNVPMEIIPLDAVPITGTGIATTTTTTKIPSATSIVITDASEKLAKSMQNMSLHEKEIRRL